MRDVVYLSFKPGLHVSFLPLFATESFHVGRLMLAPYSSLVFPYL